MPKKGYGILNGGEKQEPAKVRQTKEGESHKCLEEGGEVCLLE